MLQRLTQCAWPDAWLLQQQSLTETVGSTLLLGAAGAARPCAAALRGRGGGEGISAATSKLPGALRRKQGGQAHLR